MTLFATSSNELDSLVKTAEAVDNDRLAQSLVNAALMILGKLRQAGVFAAPYNNQEVELNSTVSACNRALGLTLNIKREENRLKVRIQGIVMSDDETEDHQILLMKTGVLDGLHRANLAAIDVGKKTAFTEYSIEGGGSVLRFYCPLFPS